MNLLVIAGVAMAGLVAVIGIQEARLAHAQQALTDYKAKEQQSAVAQMIGIARESQERAQEHLENVRGIVASVETARTEIQHVVVSPSCEKDALSDATAAAIGRVWRERNPGAPPAAAGRREPARTVPRPLVAPGR